MANGASCSQSGERTVRIGPILQKKSSSSFRSGERDIPSGPTLSEFPVFLLLNLPGCFRAVGHLASLKVSPPVSVLSLYSKRACLLRRD